VLHRIKHPLLELVPMSMQSRKTMQTFRAMVQQHLQVCAETKAYRLEGLNPTTANELEGMLGAHLAGSVVDLERRKNFCHTGIAFVQYHAKHKDHVKAQITAMLGELHYAEGQAPATLASPTGSLIGSPDGSLGTGDGDATVATMQEWMSKSRFSQWEFQPLPTAVPAAVPAASTVPAASSASAATPSYSDIASAHSSTGISAMSSPMGSEDGSTTTADTNNSLQSREQLSIENATFRKKYRKYKAMTKAYASDTVRIENERAAMESRLVALEAGAASKDREVEDLKAQLQQAMACIENMGLLSKSPKRKDSKLQRTGPGTDTAAAAATNQQADVTMDLDTEEAHNDVDPSTVMPNVGPN
jgi:hypothetical protein